MADGSEQKPGFNEAKEYLDRALSELRRREELLGAIDAQVRALETRIASSQMTSVLISGEADAIKNQAAQVAAFRTEIVQKSRQRLEVMEDIAKAKARVELAKIELRQMELTETQ